MIEASRFDLVLLEILSLASLSSLHLVMADGRKIQECFRFQLQWFHCADRVCCKCLQNSHRKNPDQIVLLSDRNFILVLLYQIMCWMEFLILLLVFLFPVVRVDIEIRINIIENMFPCFCIFMTCKTTMVPKKFLCEMTGYP